MLVYVAIMTSLYFVLFAVVLANVAALPAEPQIYGGETSQDPNDPKYKTLAQESFDKYQKTNPGGQIIVKEIKVTKTTTQVVAGVITRIDFTVTPTNGEDVTCHSEVFEQAWCKIKEITVDCTGNLQQKKVKRRMITGGEMVQDPNNPKYKTLAHESFEKYQKTNPGGQVIVKEIKVTKTTTQLVAGFITRIDFAVTPTNGEDITCHSEVLEVVWRKIKEITVDCTGNLQQKKVKRQAVGGEMVQDPNDPEYKTLAQESFEKYQKTNPGGQVIVKEIKVTKATTQVVAGSITRIDFTVTPTNGEDITCHSEVFEQAWLKKKDITVDCSANKQKSKVRRQVPGGEAEKDPNDPRFKKLAEESIKTYKKTNPGGLINVKDIKVTRVTQQVVSGIITKLNFTVEPTNGEKITCHSSVLEQPWLNKIEISDVGCDLKG